MSDSTWANSLLGRTVGGRYVLRSLIGQGGMGAVFLASHMHIGNTVAVKVMRPHLLADPEFLERFSREARAAGLFRDDGVARVLDFDIAQDIGPFLVMDFLDGVTLSRRLMEVYKLAPNTCVALGDALLSILARVHAHGIIHRDLKPANVFLASRPDGIEDVKILDFGIAQMVRAGRSTSLTVPGTSLGTPRYMAPEQALDAGSVDARADVYGAGAILYHCLSGKVPYFGKAGVELQQVILLGPPQPLRSLMGGGNPKLFDVVDCAMARNPMERYASAEDMRAALLASSGVETPLLLITPEESTQNHYHNLYDTVQSKPSSPSTTVESSRKPQVPEVGTIPPPTSNSLTYEATSRAPATQSSTKVIQVRTVPVLLVGLVVVFILILSTVTIVATIFFVQERALAPGVPTVLVPKNRTITQDADLPFFLEPDFDLKRFEPTTFASKATKHARAYRSDAKLVMISLNGVGSSEAMDLSVQSRFTSATYFYHSKAPGQAIGFVIHVRGDIYGVFEERNLRDIESVPPPKCKIAEVRRRAIKLGASPDEYYDVTYIMVHGRPRWGVTHMDYSENFLDDCK